MLGNWLKLVVFAIFAKIMGVNPINIPLVVFIVKANAEVLMWIANMLINKLKTDPTQLPNAMLMKIIKTARHKLFWRLNI